MLAVKKASELISHSDSDSWLIRDFLPAHSCSILCAAPKSGKSWLAWEIGVSLAAGSKCLGRFDVPSAKRVLILNSEDSEHIQKNRVESVSKAKGIFHDLPNLGIITTDQQLRLDQETGITELRQVISYFKCDLVILDCFVRFHQIDENNAKQVAVLLGSLRSIQRELGTSILLVHHAKKNAKGTGLGNQLRGSSELFGWVDCLISMNRNSMNDIEIEVTHRAAESLSKLPVQLRELNGGLTLVCSESIEIPSRDVNCNHSLERVYSEVESRYKAVSLVAISTALNLSVEEVRSSIYKLIKSGRIAFSKGGYLRR